MLYQYPPAKSLNIKGAVHTLMIEINLIAIKFQNQNASHGNFSFFSCQRFSFSFFFAGILIRPVALSIPYLILLFYTPFVPVATTKTIRGHTGYFFKAAIALSTITVLLQIAFQIYLISDGNNLLKPCEFLEILFRHIGMIRLNEVTWVAIFATQWSLCL